MFRRCLIQCAECLFFFCSAIRDYFVIVQKQFNAVKYVKALVVALMFYPGAALSHVKWFVDSNRDVIALDNNVAVYFFVWALIAVGVVAVGVLLEKKWCQRFSYKRDNDTMVFEHGVASIFSVLLGVYFLYSSYSGFLFSINLDNVGQWHAALVAVETFVGVSFLLGIGVRQSSIVFLMLWGFSFFYVGVLNTLENLELFGAAIFTLIYGRRYIRYTQEDIGPAGLLLAARQYGVPVLRVVLGLNLILLGFSEKILRPDLGLAFLDQYSWNFMKNYGVHWYSDGLFVFSAGAVEIILGLVLVLGLLTRLCAAVIAIVLLIPSFFMGPSELWGHIPHLSIVAVLILFGAGEKLKILQDRWLMPLASIGRLAVRVERKKVRRSSLMHPMPPANRSISAKE